MRKRREGKGNPKEGDGQIYFSCLENNGNSKRRQSFTYGSTVIYLSRVFEKVLK